MVCITVASSSHVTSTQCILIFFTFSLSLPPSFPPPPFPPLPFLPPSFSPSFPLSLSPSYPLPFLTFNFSLCTPSSVHSYPCQIWHPSLAQSTAGQQAFVSGAQQAGPQLQVRGWMIPVNFLTTSKSVEGHNHLPSIYVCMYKVDHRHQVRCVPLSGYLGIDPMRRCGQLA